MFPFEVSEKIVRMCWYGCSIGDEPQEHFHPRSLQLAGIVAALAVCRPRCSARIQKSHLPLLPPRVSAPLEFCCHHRASSERAAAACICKHAAQSERRHRSCDPWAAARSKRSRWTIRPSSDRATVPWAWTRASPRAVYFVWTEPMERPISDSSPRLARAAGPRGAAAA